jgi:hypothetical protein
VKYIMFEVESNDIVIKVPVIFPAMLVHADVARVMEPVIRKTYQDKRKVRAVSAGEVSPLDMGATYGKSDTLGLESHEHDGSTIAMYDYHHGVI